MNSQPAVAPSPPGNLAAAQHEAGAPAAMPRAVRHTLVRRGYRVTEGCAAILTAGLSTALGLVGLTTAATAPAVGSLAGRPPSPAPVTADPRLLAAGPPLSLSEHSRWIDLDGPVHYLDFGGPAGGAAVVCVHGLAGSAMNWSALAPFLTGHYRVVAPDLAGHGLTRSQGRGTDVAANRALLHRFIEAVVTSPSGPVILIGNSMGGMISLLEASAAPGTVAGLVLVNPVLPLVPTWPDRLVTPMLATLATPGLGQVLMGSCRSMSAEALVTSVLWLCCVDSSRVPRDAVAQEVAVARQLLLLTAVERDFAAAIRSIIVTACHPRGGSYRRGIRSITCPVLLLHGTRDRLVPVALARAAARANPAWSLVAMPDVGHVPQLEAPHDTASVITGWLSGAGRRAVKSAARLRADLGVIGA